MSPGGAQLWHIWFQTFDYPIYRLLLKECRMLKEKECKQFMLAVTIRFMLAWNKTKTRAFVYPVTSTHLVRDGGAGLIQYYTINTFSREHRPIDFPAPYMCSPKNIVSQSKTWLPLAFLHPVVLPILEKCVEGLTKRNYCGMFVFFITEKIVSENQEVWPKAGVSTEGGEITSVSWKWYKITK